MCLPLLPHSALVEGLVGSPDQQAKTAEAGPAMPLEGLQTRGDSTAQEIVPPPWIWSNPCVATHPIHIGRAPVPIEAEVRM